MSNNTPSSSPIMQPLTSPKLKKDDDILLHHDNHHHHNQIITLRIMCNSSGIDLPSSSSESLHVTTHLNASVHSLKENIRSVIGPSARGRYLRLIVSGRLLAPDKALLSNFKLRDGDCIHAVFAAAGIRGGQQAAMANGISRSRGVGISPTGLILSNVDASDDSDEDGDSSDDVEVGRERHGFDRLRSTGLTRDEIEAIRLYFSRHVDRFIAEQNSSNQDSSNSINNSNNNSSSDDSEEASRMFRLQMEDEWMNTQGPNSEFRLNLNTNNPLLQHPPFFINSNSETDGLLTSSIRAGDLVGTDRDFVWGFILGFFVGFIMLFWVWMPTVPHKQKLGILTGISFQLGLNLLRTMSSSASSEKEEMV